MRTTGTLLALLALAFASFGQVIPQPDQPGYDTWKVDQTESQMAIPYEPAPPYPGEASRGGGSGCDCWKAPDNTYTLAMGPNDDGSSAAIPLPFAFSLYGTNYSSCYINNNGNLSFGGSYGAYSAAGFPSANYVMVAPFWADVDTRPANGGQVWYKVTPTALYVNWVAVGYYSMQTDKLNSFQVIITNGIDPAVPNGANVSFCYLDMQWTTGSASGGSNGFGGTPATVGANKGDGINYMQFGRFDQPGTAYDGPLGANDGVDWLDGKFLSFTTTQTSANVPPVIASQSVCDTLLMCVGQIAMLDVTFLSPEPLQLTTPTSSAPTLSNYTIVTATTGLVADITTMFTPLPQDVGFHTITFTGTDNGVPPLASTHTVVVNVQQGAVMEPGSLAVCDNGSPVALLSVLGGAPVSGGVWTDPNGASHSGQFDPLIDPVGDYLYVLAGGSTCASYGTATLTTVPHADAGADAAVAYCSNGAATDLFPVLAGSPQPGGYWLNPNVTAFGGILDPATNAAGAYFYIVSGTAPCPNDTARVSVTIPLAVDPGLPTALTLCADAAPLDMVAALNGTPSLGGSWTGPSGAAFPGTYLAQSDATGVYTYLVQTQLPCTDMSTTLTLSVDAVPWAGTDGSVVKCANDPPLDLFALLGALPDHDGTWYNPMAVPHSGTLVPPSALSGAHAYVVLGSGACTHLVDTGFIAVTINPLPRIDFVAEPAAGCHPLPVTLINTTPLSDVGANCLWHFGDGSSAQGCVSVDHVYEEPGSYPVRLQVTSPEGCTDHVFRHAVVLVEPAPVASFTFSPNPGTAANSTVFFTAEDPHAVHFEWTLEDKVFGDERRAQQRFGNVLGGDYTVCLSVMDRYGCADTVCRVVPIIIPSIFLPNAFTPDGDGLNDKFFPFVLDVVREEHLLQVFDRWGGLIFSSTDPGEGWDGSYQGDGAVLPQGVYVWRLTSLPTATADKLEMIGSVTLLK